MTGNLPMGCMDADIDRAAPGYWDEPPPAEQGDFFDAAYSEVCDDLARTKAAMRGLVGLLDLVSRRDDVTPQLRDVLEHNHRAVEARRVAARP